MRIGLEKLTTDQLTRLSRSPDKWAKAWVDQEHQRRGPCICTLLTGAVSDPSNTQAKLGVNKRHPREPSFVAICLEA